MTAQPTGMPRYPGGGAQTPPPGPPGAPKKALPLGMPPIEESAEKIEGSSSRIMKWARKSGWIFLTLFCFVLFTFAKLPEERISDYIQGTISAALASRGITFNAKKAHLGLLFGITYNMKDVTLTLPGGGANPAQHIDEIEVSPAVLPLLLGKLGG